jgi:hypothetical protein
VTGPARNQLAVPADGGLSLEAIDDQNGGTMPVAQALALDEPRKPPGGCAFSKWLFAQQHRPDQVGQMAHVVARDPYWRGGDRSACIEHLKRLGANPGVQKLMGRAYDEWERRSAGSRAHDKRKLKAKARRAARKARRK